MVTKPLPIFHICSAKLLPSIPSPRLLLWQSMWMNGLPVVVRTFGGKLLVFRKCSLRLVQPVPFTVRCRLVLSPPRSLLLRVCS